MNRHLSVDVFFVPPHLNRADWFSRRLSRCDPMLSKSWAVVQSYFGGINGDTLELLSLDSNVQRNAPGDPLKHFTPTLDLSRRVSMSLIDISLFAPFSFIGPLLRFIASGRRTQLLQ